MWRSADSHTSGVIMSDAEKGIKNPVSVKIAPTDLPLAADGISIVPNPFHSTFDLSIKSKQNIKGMVAVFNSLGVKVREISGINLIKGANKISVSGSGLANGVYTVEIYTGNVKTVRKIVKL